MRWGSLEMAWVNSYDRQFRFANDDMILNIIISKVLSSALEKGQQVPKPKVQHDM